MRHQDYRKLRLCTTSQKKLCKTSDVADGFHSFGCCFLVGSATLCPLLPPECDSFYSCQLVLTMVLLEWYYVQVLFRPEPVPALFNA
jgi:hypothetical protein